ncbi:MAG: PQQ-binding-like beta-propeller repeat protein [Acidimicrobiales bacterium]
MHVCQGLSDRSRGRQKLRLIPLSRQRARRLYELVVLCVASLILLAGIDLNSAAASTAGATSTPSSLLQTGPAAWSTFHGNYGLSGVSSDTSISTLNAAQLGLEWMTQSGAPIASSPLDAFDATLGKNVVIIANTNGGLQAVDPTNGSIVWSDTLGEPIYATPTVRDGYLWVGTFTVGRMYKISVDSGAISCSFPLGTGTDLSSPTIATPPGGVATLYFGTQDNGVVSSPIMAVNTQTCQIEWSKIPFAQESGSWNPTSYGVDATGEPLVLVGSANPDSTVYALDANTGSTVWSNQNLSPTSNDVGSGLTISPPGTNGFADGVAYYAGEDGLLYAINLTTGATLWTFNFKAATTPSTYKGGRSTVAIDGNTLVFGTGTGVMAVNATTGVELWDSARTVAPDTEIISSPLIVGPAGEQVVVYGDMAGKVNVLALSNGAPLTTFQTHGYILGSPADLNGQLMIGSSDGFLYDLGLGRGHPTAYPTTTVSQPTDGSTVVNPNSATTSTSPVVFSGTVTSTLSSPSAVIAVQQDGPTGDWFNATTGTWQAGITWNQAIVSASGTNANWSFAIPVPIQGGSYEAFARGVDPSTGAEDPVGATSQITVSPETLGPQMSISTAEAAPSNRVKVSGHGFGPNESIAISLPGYQLGTVTASSTGTFTDFSVQIPKRFPFGQTAMLGVGATTGFASTAALDVTTSWSQLGGNQERTGNLPNDVIFNSEEVPDKIYRMFLAAQFAAGAPITTSPAVVNRTAYFGTSAGEVYAVNTVTGSLRWQAAASGPVDSSPAVDFAANTVVFGSNDGYVYSFNATTGALNWKAGPYSSITSSPNIADGVVYVGAGNGSLYALRLSTGTVAFHVTLGSPVTASAAIDTAKALMIVGDQAGMVTALSLAPHEQGKVIWQFSASGPIVATPLISDGRVFIGSNALSTTSGMEYALDESTGGIIWSHSLGGSPSLTSAMVGTNLAIGSSSGELFSLAAASGVVQWSYQTPSAVTGVSATVGLIFANSSNGVVTGYRNKGENVWISPPMSALTGAPAISDNAIVIGGGDGTLSVYTPYGLPMV